MANRRGVSSPTPPSRYDAICRVVYELCLVIGPLLYFLVALHGTVTRHYNVCGTPDPSHLEVEEDRIGAFQVGSDYPMYRFQENFTEPFLRAKAVRVVGTRVTFQINPSLSNVSIGRHGMVLDSDKGYYRVNLGSRIGLSVGNNLSVFKGRSRVGTLRIVETGSENAKAVLLNTDLGISPAEVVGKTVSEYTVATQIDVETSPAASIFDVLFLVTALGTYGFLWRRFGGPPISTLGPKVVGRIHLPPKVRLIGLVAASIPACWYLADFSIRAIGYLATSVYSKLWSSQVPTWLHYDTFQPALIPLFILLLGAFQAYLWTTRKSPFRWFSEKIAFRGGPFGHAASDSVEHFTIWVLEVIIVFVFARMLFGFVLGNTGIAITSCWPKAPAFALAGVSPFSGVGIAQIGKALGYIVSHQPNPSSVDAVFSSLESMVFSACILLALVGYGYALVSYLWGNRIRNVDFTIVGWVTNAVCYGPLLGIAIWTMVPQLVGTDPTITTNPLHTIILVIALALNVVYTWTIWNMGVKFGVMTDKGVRRTGFYSVVRHPSYTVEGIMFLMISCVGFTTIYQWYGACWYFVLYFFRSEREDQFMTVSNPEFVEYKKQVPYKYIPGVW